MSTLLMLDTNAASALVKGQAAQLTAKLRASPFCISVITEAELRYGLARRPINARLRRIVEALLAAVDIRPWTTESAERYGPLRAELDAVGKPLAPMDLLIAAQALAEDCTLVTADRTFTQVPDLTVKDWTVW
jgi:tRNA(fMet)-specific endonuclease VapC